MSGTPFAVYDKDGKLQIRVGERHVAEWLNATRYPGGYVLVEYSPADLQPGLFDFSGGDDE